MKLSEQLFFATYLIIFITIELEIYKRKKSGVSTRFFSCGWILILSADFLVAWLDCGLWWIRLSEIQGVVTFFYLFCIKRGKSINLLPVG